MTITLAVSFPDILIISSSGPAATDQNSSMGTYYRIDGVSRFNRPMWKKEGEDLFFYFEPNSHWAVGPDISSNSPLIYQSDFHLLYPPQTNWKYKNSNKKYELDTQLQVVGENMRGELNNIATV